MNLLLTEKQENIVLWAIYSIPSVNNFGIVNVLQICAIYVELDELIAAVFLFSYVHKLAEGQLFRLKLKLPVVMELCHTYLGVFLSSLSHFFKLIKF